MLFVWRKGGEELKCLEKSWHCIAWHLGSFIDDAKEGRVASFTGPCETCKYNNMCDFDMLDSFRLIEKKSGVHFHIGEGVSIKDVNQ